MPVVNLRARTESYVGFKNQWGCQQYFFGPQGTDMDHSQKFDTADGSGYGTGFKRDVPTIQESKIKMTGHAAMTRRKITYILNKWANSPTIERNFWYAPESLAVLSPIMMQPSFLTDKSVKGKMKDTFQFDAEFSAAGALDPGVILISPKATLTGTTGTGLEDDNTSDNGGVTTYGGAATLYLWCLDGGTTPSITVTIKHSVDGDTYTNLAVFDAMTKPGSQRIEIPSTATVNPFVQASYAISGTPTAVQALCGFSRGYDPDVDPDA